MADERARRHAEALGSFLGTGWSFPPSFSPGGAEVETVSGVADVHESLQILLATRVGERVLREGFGCNLDFAVFEQVDQQMVNRITSMVRDAILYHEPRVDLLALDVSSDPNQEGVLLIRLSYAIRSVNARFNMVFPFYTDEAARPSS